MQSQPLRRAAARSATGRRLLIACGVIVVFLAIYQSRDALLLVSAYRELFRHHPPAFPNTLWKAMQVLLLVLAGLLFAGGGLRGALRSLGLRRDFARPVGWTFLGTLPALAGFALFGHINSAPFTWFLVMTAVASPLSEELLFRGFLFRHLYEAAHWPFWLAVLANALPFALGHLYQATEIGAGLLGAAGILLITGAGAAFGAWLFVRWGWNLWPAIGFHAFMNAGAYLLGAGDTVVSTPTVIPFMAAALLATAALTMWKTGGWRVTREQPASVAAAAAEIGLAR